MAWESPVVRVTTGYLNTVNDLYPGGGTSANKYGGQLGKVLAVPAADATRLSKTSVGTLYAGTYQYVKLKAAATVPVKGAMVFWDTAVGSDQFQVLQIESGTTVTAAAMAGLWLNPSATAGQYAWIQTGGIGTVKYVPTLTGTAAVGATVFISIAGTTSIGLADVLTDVVLSGGTRFLERYLGWAIDLPSNGGTGRVQLAGMLSPRG